MLLASFVAGFTFLSNSVYGNTERRTFVDVCTANLVGTYNNTSSRKICNCAYDYWKSGGDPATGGYLCALEHGNF